MGVHERLLVFALGVPTLMVMTNKNDLNTIIYGIKFITSSFHNNFIIASSCIIITTCTSLEKDFDSHMSASFSTSAHLVCHLYCALCILHET